MDLAVLPALCRFGCSFLFWFIIKRNTIIGGDPGGGGVWTRFSEAARRPRADAESIQREREMDLERNIVREIK